MGKTSTMTRSQRWANTASVRGGAERWMKGLGYLCALGVGWCLRVGLGREAERSGDHRSGVHRAAAARGSGTVAVGSHGRSHHRDRARRGTAGGRRRGPGGARVLHRRARRAASGRATRAMWLLRLALRRGHLVRGAGAQRTACPAGDGRHDPHVPGDAGRRGRRRRQRRGHDRSRGPRHRPARARIRTSRRLLVLRTP